MKRAVNCGLVKADNMKQAILLLSFGTPRQPSDLLSYLTSIRRGKIPTERELEVLTARYDAIGQWDNKLLQTMGEEQKKTLTSLLAIDAMYLAYLHMPNSMEQAIENDIICRNIVENAGATYERLPMPNGNTLFMEAMAKAIRERINK